MQILFHDSCSQLPPPPHCWSQRPSSLCFSFRSPKLLPFPSSCPWSVFFLHTSQPLYFSLSAFYFPSPSLWLLSWPFSVATAVIYHEHPVTPSPIDWTSLNFALKQQNSQKARIIGRWTGLRWSLMKFHLISTIHPPIHPSTHPSIYLRLRLAIHWFIHSTNIHWNVLSARHWTGHLRENGDQVLTEILAFSKD